jgi:ABC-type bacteriocin/lantibiotic exporter with double-glycine peptidase domain
MGLLKSRTLNIQELYALVWDILRPERSFYWLAIVYGLAISLLTLATPISVQILISSVMNTMLVQPVVILALCLMALLICSGILNALQYWMMEVFEWRFFARITSEATLQSIHARYAHLENTNRAELINRFFEIFTVQNNLPTLLIGGFAILLQTVVGSVLVSFYHPMLLGFSLFYLLAVYAIWRIWRNQGLTRALKASELKYETARWLEELARNNSFFKAEPHIDYALRQSEHHSAAYVKARKLMFRTVFTQTIALYVLYALASGFLLGLGGLLVIEEQLTLGQLVAAELVLSTVFYSISKLGYYFALFYKLCASVEELAQMLSLPHESLSGVARLPREAADLQLHQVQVAYREKNYLYDFAVPAGSKVLAASWRSNAQKVLEDVLRRFLPVQHGHVQIAGFDVNDLEAQALRERVVVIDNAAAVECTIREFLSLSNPAVTAKEMRAMLEFVELSDVIDSLPKGMDTRLTPWGYPLSLTEVLRLKLAEALLDTPSILVLSEMFDVLPYRLRKRLFSHLCALPNLTLVYFSQRKDLEGFSHYLFLNKQETPLFDSLTALRAYEETSSAELI